MLGRKFVITKYVRKTIESKISKLPSQESRKMTKQNKVCLKKRIRVREEINKMGEGVNVFDPNSTHSAYCNVELSAAHGSLNEVVWVGRMSWLPAKSCLVREVGQHQLTHLCAICVPSRTRATLYLHTHLILQTRFLTSGEKTDIQKC